MHFELWHIPSGNLVNTFPDEQAALAVVRRAYEQDGRDAGESFALGTEDRRGRSRQLASGSELLVRALDESADRTARSS